MSTSDHSDMLSEVFLKLQLYVRGLDLFDDPSSSVILHRHLLKVLAVPSVDKLIQILILDEKWENGGMERAVDKKVKPEIEIQNSENLDVVQRTSLILNSLVKSLPDPLAAKIQAVAYAFEMTRVDTFVVAFKDLAEESGLTLKKLDEKLEKTLLQSHGKELTSQVSSETDIIQILPKIVSLLYLQVYNKALQLPEGAISAALSQLKGKLPEETLKVVKDYHNATVTLSALQAAATEDEEDCTADRILTKKEYLESKMAELKDLVLKNQNKDSSS